MGYPLLGTATAQQLVRKNAEAWESFEKLDSHPTMALNPPGYWCNQEDGSP